MACYDEDADIYQTICKVGTGFSDQNLKDFTSFFEVCLGAMVVMIPAIRG